MRAIVAVADEPIGIDMFVGLTDMLKSGGGMTIKEMVRIWTKLPLVPLTLTL